MTGASAGLLWVSSGRYIHLVCLKYNDMERKGLFYGLYNASYCLINVSAGLITTFGLGFFDPLTYFFITTAFGCVATLFCWFFVRDVSVEI